MFQFRFQDHQRLALFVRQQKVNESLRAFFKVRTETFDVLRLQLDVRLKTMVAGPFLSSTKRQPARLEQSIDFDRSCCFLAKTTPIPRQYSAVSRYSEHARGQLLIDAAN
jgi:hypothetical protein